VSSQGLIRDFLTRGIFFFGRNGGGGKSQWYKKSEGAGRKGQSFTSYLKAFLLAPVLRVEQNSEAVAAEIAGNPAFYVACEFTSHPAARTLRDFDQILSEYGLWDLVHDVAYRKNVEDKVIDEKSEDTLNIDNTHLFGYSTPGKYGFA